MRWLVASLIIALSGSQACAAIKLCNKFEHPVRFALAFESKDGWVSEGWIKVEPKACQTDNKHTDLNEFYWRGETDWIKTPDGRTQWSWGKNRKFSVKDGSFSLSKADRSIAETRLVGFAGPVTVKDPSVQQITLTIVDAKSSSTSISSAGGPTKADPDYRVCETSSGEEAFAACGRAIASGKFRGALLANLHINRGVEYQGKKDQDAALADFDEAIRIDPTNPTAFVNRASIRYNKKSYDAAIEDLNKAIERDPKYVRAYADRGDAYRQTGDLNRAVADYKQALALNPKDSLKQHVQKALDELQSSGAADARKPGGSGQ